MPEVPWIVCPHCETRNLAGREYCLGCSIPLAGLAVDVTGERAAVTDENQPIAPVQVEPGRAVYDWYRVYCGVILVLHLILVLIMVAMASANPTQYMPSGIPSQALKEMDKSGIRFQKQGSTPQPISEMFKEMDAQDRQRRDEEAASRYGMVFFLFLLLVAPPGIALLLPPSPAAWVYHIVILCLGLGGCSLPFSVILLIHWFKPETQAFFGRGTPPIATT
jgi:hypothetical protein